MCNKAGLNARLHINHIEEQDPGAHGLVKFKPMKWLSWCLDVDCMMQSVAYKIGKRGEENRVEEREAEVIQQNRLVQRRQT